MGAYVCIDVRMYFQVILAVDILILLGAVPTHIQPHTSTTYCMQFCARNAGIQVSIRLYP